MIRFALTLLFFIVSGLALAGTATSPTVTEGNNAIVTFDLGYTAPAGGVEVYVQANSATATLGTDFTVAASQLGYRTIAAGDQTLTVTAAIINDGVTEGNETFPVAFLENVSSNATFDGGATEWSDKTIRTQPNVDFTSSSPPMSNNVLHIQNKEQPYRSATLNSGTDYTLEFDWSEADADGYGSYCDDSSMYPGYINAADRLVLQVIDTVDSSNNASFTIDNNMGNGAAQTSSDSMFNFQGEVSNLSWTGNSAAQIRFVVYDVTNRQYEGSCGYVIDNFRINKSPVQTTVTISDPDTTPPTVTIASSTVTSGDTSNDASIALSFTLSEAATDFAAADIAVTNGTISSFSGSGTAYTATFTPTSDGATSISVPANRFTDAASNGNTASSAFSWTYDSTAPTVTLSSSTVTSGDTTNDSSIALSFTLSEAATDFTSADVSTSGGTLSSFSGSGTAYTATFTPSSDGPTSVSVAAGRFTDGAGNTNSASSAFSWTYDSTAPTVTISSGTVSSGATSNDSSISLTFTLSEAATDFISSDLSVTNGTISSFSGSGTSYSATFTPTSDGATSISVAANRFTDAASNGNTASSAFSWTYDGTAPTVTISSSTVSNGATSNDSSISLTFTLSEAATDFTSADVSVTNATLSSFSGSGTSYTATLTPAANGATSVSVAAGRFSDAVSNTNTASSAFAWTYDAVAPTVTITSSTVTSGDTTSDASLALSFTISEATTDFTASDISVSNGSISSFSGSGTSYTATFTPTANGATSISVAANTFTDSATNDNTASATFTWTYDTAGPTVAISSSTVTSGDISNDSSIALSFTTSEATTDFTSSDISVTNGAISSFSGSGTSYTATFTPAANGATSISVAANAFTDSAANGNTASSSFAWTYDAVAPTVTITSSTVTSGDTSNDSSIALTFTTSKSTTDFTSSDISVTNGAISGFAGSGTSYTATFTPAANGATSISVAANAFTDSAANGNTASATFAWTYNTQPSVSFAAATSSASEASSSASVTLNLSHSYYQPVSVSYTLSGTATGGGQDFTHAASSVTIPVGITSATITIAPIVDDSLAEGDETIILTLSSPVNASLGATTSHTYTITDNDGASSLSIADATTSDESAAIQTLTVSLSPASSSVVTVDYALTGGTATSGTDFAFASGTLSFAAGDTSKTISVPVIQDSDVEGDETVIIGLSNPTGGAVISDASGTLTITDDDAAPTTNPNQAIVDDAILDTQTIIAKHVSGQGKALLHASQNLIQTSIDHLIVRTQLQAKRRNSGTTGTQTASRPPTADGQTSGGQTSDSPPPAPAPSASFTEQAPLADRLADAVKLLQVDADDFGYSGALDFNLYEPVAGRNSALITKITASFSDQDNGPETSNLLASFALETESEDGESILGRFLHLTQTKADFRFTQSGTQDSKGVSGGIYTVYSPKVDHLLTAFVSFGVAQTDLDLSVSSAAVKDSYNSLNAQAGVSLARTIQRPGLMMVWEMAAESLLSRQQSRYASVLVGGSTYRAQISARTVTDTSAIFTPKFIFDLQDSEDEQPSNLQLAPSVRCGSGTGGSSCGYGVSASLSQMTADREGHTSLGLSVDRYRNTDTISYFIDINRSLMGHKDIRFDTHLKQLFTGGASGGRPEYAINSVVRLPL